MADKELIQPLWYYAYIAEERPNICIMSSDELADPIHRKLIMDRFPQLIYPDNFLENDTAYNDYFAADLCWRNANERFVYIQYGVNGLDNNYVTPDGLLFRYIGYDGTIRKELPKLDLHYKLTAQLSACPGQNPETDRVAGRWLFGLGRYFENIGASRTGWRLYNRALSIDMQNIDMRIHLAASLALAGEYKEALKSVSDALAIEPQNPEILELGRRIVDRMEAAGLADSGN